jgi:hypothetical protein
MRWQQQQQHAQQQQQGQQHSHLQQQQQATHTSDGRVAQPRLIVALEKRYNFTLRDMDAVASAFEHFMTYIQPTEASLEALPPQEQQHLRQQQQQQPALFKGERIDVSGIPQVCISARPNAAGVS